MQTLTQSSFKEIINSSKKPCIVKFKSDVCHHCVRLDPEVDELSEKYGSFYDFYKIDVDEEPEAQKFLDTFGDGGVPSIFIYLGDEFTEVPWEQEYSYEYLDIYLKTYLEKHEHIS